MEDTKKPQIYLVIIAALVLTNLLAVAYVGGESLGDFVRVKIMNKNIETSELKERAARHIILPKDQDPTIAKIENADELKQQNEVFYANVKNGDYLFVFEDTALIYDVENDRLVNYAPINKNGTPEPDSETPAQPTTQTPE